ncbi:MAG TPA: DUF29 domain-containing protein [Bryobacteraceae bacterium]|nr:DUF29 domain-containing protein [Bryobacteraceae bacterium]
MKPTNSGPAKLYEVDFCEWSRRTATLLREKRFDELQLPELAEEVADMGKRDRREARSRSIVLLTQLLKCKAQPELRAGSNALAIIADQREQVALLLEDSPSIHKMLEHELPLLFARASRVVVKETGAAYAPPADCPFTLAEILNSDFLPE